MMTREFRDEWVAALRSGEFEQGRGALERDGKFCCIGVRCALDVRKGEMTRVALGESSTSCGFVDDVTVGYTVYGTVLYSTSQRWGMEQTTLDLTPGLLGDLMFMNDAKGKTFHEIADFLMTVPVIEMESAA